MNLCNINHSFNYELEKLCRIFLPYEKINILSMVEPDSIYAVSTLKKEERLAVAELFWADKRFYHEQTLEDDEDKTAELALASSLFRCFESATGYTPEWGLLTGVRPVKLYSRLYNSIGKEKTDGYFKEKLFVSDEKISLCYATMEPEQGIVGNNSPDSFSLYVSIPFCPSRCSYCSFVSHSIDKAGKLIDDYVKLLCKELEKTAEIAKDRGLRLRTVYIGGGTPVALSAPQIEQVMKAISDNFDLNGISEYTVEAGRPDAIDADKLRAIKNGGATRISVNPQTMNDSVLEAIGRRHTAAQTEEAFRRARSLGFDNINMDLIAGLPTDTAEGFENTLKRVLALDPESVTVHSLSVKKAANISINNSLPEFETGKTASRMVRHARGILTDRGIAPYYMYRQSKTVGNLENVGYAKSGYEGLYNVYIMDETHTILACGASAVTKLRQPGGDYIERIFNFKYPYEYISRFDEMLARKQGISDFYDRYPL
ncbi:MAG: coproporphyrinogen dehydrogenase HemZ [Clostridia bacterium]|nr:coproporphyrinogen dehydrogenase HemZ [Clostridia bacterium]